MGHGRPVVERRHVRLGWCSKFVDTSNAPSSLLDNRSVSLHRFIPGSSNLGLEKDSGYSARMGCGWDLVETHRGSIYASRGCVPYKRRPHMRVLQGAFIHKRASHGRASHGRASPALVSSKKPKFLLLDAVALYVLFGTPTLCKQFSTLALIL
jgi:hypothetical protein